MVEPLTKVEIQLVRQFRVNEVSRQIFQPIKIRPIPLLRVLKQNPLPVHLRVTPRYQEIEAITTSMRGENSCDQQTYKLVSYLVLRVCRLSIPRARDPKTGVVFSWVPEFN